MHKYDFDGELNLYEGRGSNFCITDNHNLLVKKHPKSDQWMLKTYEECAQEFIVRRGSTWSGHKTSTMTFRSVVPMFHGGARVNEWTFSYIDWARFLGWFVSEGSTYVEKRKHGRGRVQITQMPGFKKETIRMLLTKMDLHFRENGDQFEFSNNTICDHLRRHCGTGASNKRIPRYIKEATPEIIDAFLQAFRLGDGTCKESGKGRTYGTTSQFLADDIQECLVKVGRAGKLTHLKMKGTTTVIQGRSMTRHHDQYLVYERSRGSGSYIKKREVQKVPYKGIVYCVSTPHRTIMVRRNGCPMWSGNSDRTARTYREGAYTHWIRVTQQESLMQTAGRVAADLADLPGAKANLDVIGLGGGVVDRLTELHLPATGVNVAEKANDPDRFANVRAEAYWHLRTLFETGQIMIPEDDGLINELTQLKYKIVNSNGTIRLEEKEEMKKRLVQRGGNSLPVHATRALPWYVHLKGLAMVWL